MSVEITVLDNRLRVVTDTVKTVETASVGVWVKAGARNETKANNGVAHFLEHMAFKGTKTRSAKAIAEAIENVGGYLNAYTSREMTAYYARVLKNDVPLAIDILGDILQHSVFSEEEMKKEREVILQEIGQSNDTPDDIVFDYYQDTSFPEQSMGRPILGPAENVKSLGRQDLVDFMARQYVPENMVLAAAGNVDHSEVVALAKEHFSALSKRGEGFWEVPHYAGGDCRHSRELEQLHVVLGFEGVSFKSDDYFTSSLVAVALGGGMSSRLFQEVREKRGLVYSVYAFSNAFSDVGSFGIYAGAGEKESPELIQVILGEVEKSANTFRGHELDRAKAQLKASTLMAFESTANRAKRVAQNILMYDRVIPQSEIIECIDRVTLTDMSEFVQARIQTPLTFSCIGPHDKLPDFQKMQALVA